MATSLSGPTSTVGIPISICSNEVGSTDGIATQTSGIVSNNQASRTIAYHANSTLSVRNSVATRTQNNWSWSASDWIEGAGACWGDNSLFLPQNSHASSWSDWDEGAGSCFVETWREPNHRAELAHAPEASSDCHAPPVVVRSFAAHKTRKRSPSRAGKAPRPLKASGKPITSVGPALEPPSTLTFEFVVVGSGVAGLRYALAVAEKGRVAVVTKSEPQESSTRYAQGGVSAVLDPRDSVENHIRDTIVAGAYLCDEEAVEVVCREGPARVRELMAMGASFDRGEDGRLHLAREGGHSHHRIVHAADVTGREIERALLTAVQQHPNIHLFEHHFAVELLTRNSGGSPGWDPDWEGGESLISCHGVDALNLHTNKVVRFMAGSVLLASGGAGHVYPSTTNPTVATGDGVALAHRAGATISNMEFVQFHPTALADEGLPLAPSPPRDNAFLITEAVRGAGGLLYNQAGERFMPTYDVRAELAPRDVVARSIDDQLKVRGEKFVWLDISHLGEQEIVHHFPNIAGECLKYGVDITKQPIPVVPAAHYMCGGVQTGLHGETSIKGLWAAGEVACTGLHGANRLASNSLLEALVFAQRAVEPAVLHALEFAEENFAIDEATEWKRPEVVVGVGEDTHVAGQTAVYRKALQDIMWDYVGIVRSTERLLIAEKELIELEAAWHTELARSNLSPNSVTQSICEMRNLLSVATLIVRSALQRQESRGLHYTIDFPKLVESQRMPTVLTFEPKLSGLTSAMELISK